MLALPFKLKNLYSLMIFLGAKIKDDFDPAVRITIFVVKVSLHLIIEVFLCKKMTIELVSTKARIVVEVIEVLSGCSTQFAVAI